MANLNVTLTGSLGTTAAGGSATFTPSGWETDATNKLLIPPSPQSVTLPTAGTFSVSLLATDNPAPLPAGWTWSVTFQLPGINASTFSFFLPASPFSFTATHAAPAVFTAAGSAYVNGAQVVLSGAGLPGGFTAGTTYFVVGASGITFELAATSGGAALASTTTGSGTVATATTDISTLAQYSPAPAVLAFLPLPSGTPAAGQVPVATGSGETSAWTAPAGIGVRRPATFTVAASNASAAWQAAADYVCTGTNDDVTILAAAAALPSQGGTILLSDGTFTIGHALIPTVNRTKLRGQGPDCTVVQAAIGANCNGYQFDTSQGISLIFESVEGVTFNGNYNNGAGNTSGYGCHINYSLTNTFWDFYLRDVWFDNWAQDGFWATGGHGYVLDHVLAEFCGGNGINFTGGFTDSPPRIVNGTVKLNGGTGILINVTDALVEGMEVSSNSGSYGIALTSSGAKVIGNQVKSNTGTGVHVSGNEGHQVIGNTIAGNGQHGILADTPNNAIAGNFLNNNSVTSAGAADEINVTTGSFSAPGQMITGNVIDCQNQSRYGINLANANDTGAVLAANRIVGARTAPVNSLANDTLILDATGLSYGSGSAKALDLTPLLAPAGATAETFPRQYSANAYFSSLVSGTVYLSAIALPAGLPVNNLTMVVGGTGFTVVTHGWYVLCDSTRTVRAVSADQAAGNWGTPFQAVTLSVAPGYTTPSPGVYYVGFCAVFSGSGTLPAMFAPVGGLTTNLAPVLCGSSSTGLSTPPATGTQLAVISPAAGDRFYAYTS